MPRLVCGLRQKIFSKGTSPRLRRKKQHIRWSCMHSDIFTKEAGRARRHENTLTGQQKLHRTIASQRASKKCWSFRKRSGQMCAMLKPITISAIYCMTNADAKKPFNIGSVPARLMLLLLFPGETWELHGTTYEEMQSALWIATKRHFGQTRQMRVYYMNSISFANVPEFRPPNVCRGWKYTALSWIFVMISWLNSSLFT